MNIETQLLDRYTTPYSIYINGAINMLLKLRQHFLLNESYPNQTVSKEDKVINKAIFDLILSSKSNMEYFLTEKYEIRLKDHKYDKRGKLISCTAYYLLT